MERTVNGSSLPTFTRAPLPPRFCNFERLLETMEARRIDGTEPFFSWDFDPLTGN